MMLPSAGNIRTTCKSFNTLSGVSLGYSIELEVFCDMREWVMEKLWEYC
jgi:hypothetical protein